MNALYATGALGATLHDSMAVLLDLDSCGGAPTPPGVAQQVARLCGFEEGGASGGGGEEFFAKLERDHGEDGALMIVRYVTGFEHEVRHAHDLLSTVYGQENFFQAFSFFRIASALIADLADWQNGESSRPIVLPLRADRAPEALRDVLAQCEQYGALTTALHEQSSLSPEMYTVVHLLETSAMNHQIELAAWLFGQRAADALESTMERPVADLYLDLRNRFRGRFLRRGWSASTLAPLQNCLIWYALQGATPAEGSGNDGPRIVDLYQTFVEHLLARLEPDSEWTQIVRAIGEVYEEWGLLTAQVTAGRYVAELKRRAKDVPTDAGAIRWDMFGLTYEAMTTRIYKYPDFYFDPIKYYRTVASGQYPALYLKVRYQQQVHETLTPGHEIIPFQTWSAIANTAVLFNILMRGRGSAPMRFDEDRIFEEIAAKSGLHFFDSLFD